MTEPLARHIEGTTALVTGANRGLGMAFVQALLDRGAAKVYAGARNPGTVDVTDARVVPVQLDITNFDDIAAAARDCADVSLLVNNAGAMLLRPFLSAPDMSAARTEMETNYFGTLAMARAFAPVLGAAGGGGLVNVLSVVSWLASPFNASYCASKSAEWALTNALRVELRAQGTLVVGVYAGFVDTDMTKSLDVPKVRPEAIVAAVLAGIESGTEEVLADERAREVATNFVRESKIREQLNQQAWDQGQFSRK